MRLYLTLLVYLAVFNPYYAQSQKVDWGFNLGYGVSNFSKTSKVIVNPFIRDQPQHLTTGITYDYSPWKGLISLRTGLWYYNRKQNDTSLNYFKIPIGFDLNFGKNHQFILGGGLYGSLLFHYNGLPKTYDYKDGINRFVIGGYLNLGISIRVSDHYFFSLRYQVNQDSSPFYQNNGTHTFEKTSLSDGIFTLGIKYRIS